MNNIELNNKLTAWKIQSAALSAPKYRVTLMRRGDGRNYSRDTAKNALAERFFTADDVGDHIGELTLENERGWNVFVTPIDTERHYIVIDDVPNVDAVTNIEKHGYVPRLVQSTSKNSIQMILCLPKLAEKHEQQNANKLVVKLNQNFGDPGFTGVVHPFRLAGFRNKKPGRENAATEILATANSVTCKKAADELAAIRAEAQQRAVAHPLRAPTLNKPCTSMHVTAPGGTRYTELRSGFEYGCQVKGWPVDDSLIDFKTAKQMAADGFSVDDIAAAIFALSPRLFDRHPNADGYSAKVARNAFRF
jgi:hypothetical protein